LYALREAGPMMIDWDHRHAARVHQDRERHMRIKLPSTGSYRVDWLLMLIIVVILLIVTL
jgi:hypothetical protein